MNRVDLTGRQFNRWHVDAPAPDRNGLEYYYCTCSCGTRRIVNKKNLLSGVSKSCGCYKKERASKSKYSHKNKRLYSIWKNIKTRCNNKNTARYKDYGARGIYICDEWANDFELFQQWAENNGYNDLLSIDRINNSDGYNPTNCRWVTLTEQQRNKTNNHLLEYKGEVKTISEWAEICHISPKLIEKRINVYHWPIDRALAEPSHNKWARNSIIEFNGQAKSIIEWADYLGINVSTLRNRLFNLQWPVERALSQPVRRTAVV